MTENTGSSKHYIIGIITAIYFAVIFSILNIPLPLFIPITLLLVVLPVILGFVLVFIYYEAKPLKTGFTITNIIMFPVAVFLGYFVNNTLITFVPGHIYLYVTQLVFITIGASFALIVYKEQSK